MAGLCFASYLCVSGGRLRNRPVIPHSALRAASSETIKRATAQTRPLGRLSLSLSPALAHSLPSTLDLPDSNTTGEKWPARPRDQERREGKKKRSQEHAGAMNPDVSGSVRERVPNLNPPAAARDPRHPTIPPAKWLGTPHAPITRTGIREAGRSDVCLWRAPSAINHQWQMDRILGSGSREGEKVGAREGRGPWCVAHPPQLASPKTRWLWVRQKRQAVTLRGGKRDWREDKRTAFPFPCRRRCQSCRWAASAAIAPKSA